MSLQRHTRCEIGITTTYKAGRGETITPVMRSDCVGEGAVSDSVEGVSKVSPIAASIYSA